MKKKYKPKKRKLFCSHCGKRLVYVGLKGSEHFGMYAGLGAKYDQETGRRLLREVWSCPKYSNFWPWGFSHNSYGYEIEDDIEVVNNERKNS